MAFHFGGGFPFGGGMEEEFEDMDDREVDNNQLYELLGVSQDANQKEITKAYRKLAMKHHPDKGGDPEQFRLISEANEILSNSEKREIYDKYGMEGLKEGGGGRGHPADIFSMFGMGQGSQKQQKQQKGKAVLKKHEVTLEDVYLGKLFNIKHDRTQLCEGCDGKGGKNQKKCQNCKGQGMVVKMQMVGPGMYQQSQAPCKDCKGQGVIQDQKDVCQQCNGKKIKKVQTNLEVAVEQGCPNEHDYIFYGKGDEAPGGDIHVRIFIKKHKTFERKGADLFIDKKISLLEALTGTTFQIKKLDGQMLKVTTLPNEVLSHLELKCIKGQGMPFYKDSCGFGNLYVKFFIQMPQKGELNEQQIEGLKNLLPGPKIKKMQQGEQFEYLDDYHESDMNPNPQGGNTGKNDDDDDYEDEDEDPRHGQNVQCAQQ